MREVIGLFMTVFLTNATSQIHGEGIKCYSESHLECFWLANSNLMFFALTLLLVFCFLPYVYKWYLKRQEKG